MTLRQLNGITTVDAPQRDSLLASSPDPLEKSLARLAALAHRLRAESLAPEPRPLRLLRGGVPE